MHASHRRAAARATFAFLALAAACGLAGPARAEPPRKPLTCDQALLSASTRENGWTVRIVSVIALPSAEVIYSAGQGGGHGTMSLAPGVYLVQLRLTLHPGLGHQGFARQGIRTMTVHVPAGLAVDAELVSGQDGRDFRIQQRARRLDALAAGDLPSDLAPAAPLQCGAPEVASATAAWASQPDGPVRPLQASTAADAAKVRLLDRHPTDLMFLYPQDDCNDGRVVNAPAAMPAVLQKFYGIDAMRPAAGDGGSAPPPEASDLSVAPDQVVNIGGGPDCGGGVSFTARAATRYEVTFEKPSARTCTYTVKRVEADPDGQLARTPEQTHPLVCRPRSQ